jgi:hypothetical protein
MGGGDARVDTADSIASLARGDKPALCRPLSDASRDNQQTTVVGVVSGF